MVQTDDEVEALYRTMGKDDLVRLYGAFGLDRILAEDRGDTASAAFCTNRIRILHKVLGKNFLRLKSTPRA